MDTAAAIIGLIAIAVVLSVLLAFPVMWIMNYVFSPSALVAVFGVQSMTLWKAFWFGFLCQLLFKGSSGKSSN